MLSNVRTTTSFLGQSKFMNVFFFLNIVIEEVELASLIAIGCKARNATGSAESRR